MCAAPGSPFAHDKGPEGLLRDRPVYLVMGLRWRRVRQSAVDFASGYLRQVLRFIGIEDVRLIGAERSLPTPMQHANPHLLN